MVFGQWQSSEPSRFVKELPDKHIDVVGAQGLYGSKPTHGWGEPDFWDTMPSSNAPHGGHGPGWHRAKSHAASGSSYGERSKPKRRPQTIQGTAKATPEVSAFAIGERIFHEKFGYGIIEDADGNKLTINFEQAGLKKVVDSFVTLATKE